MVNERYSDRVLGIRCTGTGATPAECIDPSDDARHLVVARTRDDHQEMRPPKVSAPCTDTYSGGY